MVPLGGDRQWKGNSHEQQESPQVGWDVRLVSLRVFSGDSQEKDINTAERIAQL